MVTKFKYMGQPTAGTTTKDIKLLCEDNTFVIFENVIPGETEITVSDSRCIEYMEKNSNFLKLDNN